MSQTSPLITARAIGVVVLVCAVLRTTAAAPATAPVSPRQPICVILVDPAGEATERAAATLLEAELTQGGGLRTVERGAIEQVIKEQELQQLFGSDAGPRRQARGQLLKADLLVLIPPRPVTRSRRRPLVVCETSQGLRRCNVSLDEPAAGGAGDAARQLIDAAITKWRTGSARSTPSRPL